MLSGWRKWHLFVPQVIGSGSGRMESIYKAKNYLYYISMNYEYYIIKTTIFL